MSMGIPQISSNERRSLARVPLQVKFRLRDDRGTQTFAATSHDIHPCGIQLETTAPLVPQTGVELWPDDNILEAYYVHGEVCWVKPLKESGRYRCGVNFNRRIAWNIPLALFSRTYSASALSGGTGFADCILDSIVDGVFSVDHNWRITAFNRAAEELTGWKRQEAVGRICREVFKANCCGKECVLAESVKTRQPIEDKAILITHANGNRIGATISAAPLLDNNGNCVGGVQVFRSVKASVERAMILDDVGDGIFTMDTQWRITSFNKTAERITGVSRAEAIGKACRDVLRTSLCGEACPVAHSISTGKAEINHNAFLHNIDKARIPVSICATPFYDNSGILLGGVEAIRDLRLEKSGRKEQQREVPGEFRSNNSAMKKMVALLPRLAQSDSNVLLLGQPGTGRELLARSLHLWGERRQGPFVVVHCGALPDALLEEELFGSPVGVRRSEAEQDETTGDAAQGSAAVLRELEAELFGSTSSGRIFTMAENAAAGRFPAAEGGTLFLSGVDALSPAMQVKLLRALVARGGESVLGGRLERSNVRIVASASDQMEKEVLAGRFRQDLLYRLNVIKLDLPPLRERLEDLQLLIDYFIGMLNQEKGRDIAGVSEEVMRMLLAYDYPGNVQELQNILEYAVILCPGSIIQPAHLPTPLTARAKSWAGGRAAQDEPLPLIELEKRAISKALLRNDWKRMATCRELGISKDTLRRKISQYGIAQTQESELPG